MQDAQVLSRKGNHSPDHRLTMIFHRKCAFEKTIQYHRKTGNRLRTLLVTGSRYHTRSLTSQLHIQYLKLHAAILIRTASRLNRHTNRMSLRIDRSLPDLSLTTHIIRHRLLRHNRPDVVTGEDRSMRLPSAIFTSAHRAKCENLTL